MKIVNKFKFARFICILAALVIGTTYVAHTSQNDWLNDYTTTTVVVQYGDTLWTIADDYVSDDIDIRDYIYEVRKLNNMTSANVYAGDVITIYERSER